MHRIAFLVTRSDNIGGSHVHVKDMALALMRNEYEVSVIIGGNGPVINFFKEKGIKTFVIPNLQRNISPIWDISAYFQIKKVLKELDPDLISTHSSKAGFLGRLIAYSLEIPVVFTVHGWSFTTGKSRLSRSVYRYFEGLVVPLTNKFITVSNFDKELGVEYLKIPDAKITTIHNGMPDIDKKYLASIKNQSPVEIIKVARFDNQKDHLELLDAVHNIDNIHLHFVGDGPLMDAVKEKAKSLHMLARITFWGRSDSVEKILSNAQIFTLISNWEGFPRSTLEAMRAGLPVIVSDVGGAGEAVVHGKTGYIVEKGNTEKLKQYIKYLVDNPKERGKMGDAGRSRFEEFFTFDQMYLKTTRIYDDLLNDVEKYN